MLPRGAISFGLAFVVVVVAAVLCGRVPLLANPGPESGMILAVVGGVALALAQSRRGAFKDPSGFFNDWIGGVVVAGSFVLVFLISTTIGGAVSPTCSPNGGRLPMLLLAVPVLLLQAAVGVVVGRAIGRRGLALFACFVLEVVIASSMVVDFFREPGFRAASHFFVVVSGDLLRGADLSVAAIGFRTATALLCAVVVLVGSALWPAQKKSGLGMGQASTGPLWAVAVVVGVVFFIAHGQARMALSPSRREMEKAYSLVKKRGPLVVHADPLQSTPRDVDGILAEGTLWFERLEGRLGPLSRDDIHIWLHASREAQAHWTGASHVDFALPWRRETHVSSPAMPHRSLGHELAHIVVGEKSDTLFKVPTRFFVLHNPAVTEGVAMALTPELVVDSGLTLREQAAAMRRAGRAPDLRALFSHSRFFAEEPGRAYVAAGALVEQIVADAGDEGPAVLARLYKGDGSLESVVVDVDDLIARHTAALDRTPLPDDALAFAAARFSRQSILQETCDPEAREDALEVRRLARTGHLDQALEAAARLEGSTEDDVADGTLTDLLVDARGVSDDDGAITLLRALVARSPGPAERALREFALGGELWRRGDEREAVALWEQVDVEMAESDMQRQIRAATIFGQTALRLHDDAVVSRAALLFFVESGPARDGARIAFAEAVGRLPLEALRPTDVLLADQHPEPPEVVALGRYILGRQLVLTGALDDAVRVLRPVVDGALLTPEFQQQAVLALGTALVRKGKPDDARPLFATAAAAASRPADRLFLRDRADRAARAAKAPQLPSALSSESDPASGDRLLLGIGAGGL
ncbi:MAG: hypothetical protein Q8O67_01210 [Deltaproteobacteria bacterium]|nr:hypothetical protein [Deltaproteobacteria bacterium]